MRPVAFCNADQESKERQRKDHVDAVNGGGRSGPHGARQRFELLPFRSVTVNRLKARLQFPNSLHIHGAAEVPVVHGVHADQNGGEKPYE